MMRGVSRKGIAVPYIIALILGIAVVALLGYWFFVLGGSFSTEASLTECQTKMRTFCLSYSGTGYTPAQTFTDTCGSSGVADTDSPECCSYKTTLLAGYTNWKDACMATIG